MIVIDGYSLIYRPNMNQIVITVPQTETTVSNTVSMISNRRLHLTSIEEAAILSVVKAIMENGKEE